MTQIRWASKKSGGSTSNGRTSRPKFLGFKKMHNAPVEEGNIILRQRGTQFHAGEGVGVGKDHTLYAQGPGRVVIHYDLKNQRRLVSVDPSNSTEHSSAFLPSKAVIKQRLRDMIDVKLYLSLDAKGRYDHVCEKIEELNKQLEQEQLAEKAITLTKNGHRKFHLADLTMI
jgi:large subunit ribosomal protein L27